MTCTVQKCTGVVLAKGLCAKHYHRVRRRGSFTDGPTCQGVPEKRFWRFVKKMRASCWLWAGGRQAQGYGAFGNGERVVYAHRFSWQLHNGPIPKGLNVLHRCDVPPCVNPKHLFIGTHADNMRDKIKKSRQWLGGKRG
jgi:hypothetical protein